MIKLTDKQKETLVNYIIWQPNTQTAEAIIAQQILELSAELGEDK